MGCDIHMFIEYRNTGCPWQADEHHKASIEDTCITRCKDKKDYCDFCRVGKVKDCDMAYRHFRQVAATGRDYKLFALLASVRGDGDRKAKGLPSDVSDTIRSACMLDGGHSHSYMPLEEFKRVLFEEYKPDEHCRYVPTKRTDIFYDWEDYKENHKDEPPAFSSIVTYCEQLKEKYNVEKYILDNDSLNDVEVRLVFWFDS